MASSPDQIAEEPAQLRSRGWRYALSRGAVLLIVLLLGLVVVGWTQREDIARDLIGDELEALGIPATYSFDDFDPDKQVLTDIVVGDPARPDLTIERAVIELSYGFGVPEIGRVTVEKARLYGTYSEEGISLGALDPLLFADDPESEGGLPAFDVVVRDGRARIDTDMGPVGIKLEGEGPLDSGFAGKLAAIAPALDAGSCALERATAYGDVSTNSGAIRFKGPLRVASLACPEGDLSVSQFAWQSSVEIGSDFDSIRVEGGVATGPVSASSVSLGAISGPVMLGLRDSKLTSDFDLAGQSLAAAPARAGTVTIDGTLRSGTGLAELMLDAQVGGQGVSVDSTLPQTLADLAKASEGTLASPLLTKLRDAVQRELRDLSFAGSLVGRFGDEQHLLTLPDIVVRTSSGSQLASFSGVQYRQAGEGIPLLSGNFRVSGNDLPRMAGRMEGNGARDTIFRLRMEQYASGESSLAVPEMLVTQAPSGAVTFGGELIASGPLPGGSARNLKLPVDGTWSSAAGLALWRQCTAIGFSELSIANLALANRSLTLCPAAGRAIASYDDGGIRLAAGAPSLDLAGTLAGTPIDIESGAIGLAYPGVAAASAVSVTLGEGEAASTFRISDLLANLGDDITGTFDGADIALAAVPLDLVETRGAWNYTDGVFAIADATFTLKDRQAEKRFEPLPVTGGTLTLDNNLIEASASIRAPTNGAEVSRVSLTHSLTTGAGFADLAVDGLRFDEGLQPTDLTPLALGVVANVDGLVTGSGRIDWSEDSIDSFGAFSSESLDLAAAFGPVKGASGTIAFSDLLSLTTAPDQVINVASINPGIEARDGTIGFNLRDGQFLGVTGGQWPFMGGQLYLRPVNLNLGVAERRRYVLEVEGIDAGLFVANMELGNLAATGTFDGALPLVFDEEGFGTIEGGALQSRSPGGNVSYVGELTYEDLSPIADYTFQTLRSLDYDSMTIGMDGPLTGDIVTKVRFSGVKQGEGTKQNFITRQIADLPIQLNVNIRAPFYKLVTSLKSMYDPAAVRDPRDIGLLTDDGTRFVAPSDVPPPQPAPPPEDPVFEVPAIRPDESSIQSPDSEEMP